MSQSLRRFCFRDKQWIFDGKTYILAIMNLTPDSFSDGDKHFQDPGFQVEKAARLLEDGADALDLGAESTRPGHTPITEEEEWERLGPMLKHVRSAYPTVPISVDTYKRATAERALTEGADMINDIWGLTRNAGMAGPIAAQGAGIILMYNTQEDPSLPVPIAAVQQFFADALKRTKDAGIMPDHLLVDPGVGFRLQGPSVWTILTHLGELSGLGAGILVGQSRKRFLGKATGIANPQDRDLATAVLSAFLSLNGTDVVRVHNPAATRQALQIAKQWRAAGGTD
ncbi:MAG: dihydropteroate synthase [Thermaerobacter sp.]|nr:dihydropteroate synthase [Thermaerobacter sp.]